MMDKLSQTYVELLEGSYDCPDRIVLNAYYRAGHIPGGFRLWWRRLYGSDETLDDSHLMRMAGRFSRRLRAYAAKAGIPVIYCQKGEAKHQIAQEHLPADPNFVGLFLVLVGKASALCWHVQPGRNGGIRSIVATYRLVNHYYFHLMDPDWGHVTIAMSGHPPFAAQVILNGHEYVSCQARQAGIIFAKEGNCFTMVTGQAGGGQLAETSRSQNAIGSLAPVSRSANLAQWTDTLSVSDSIGLLRQVCDRWLYSSCLHFGLPGPEQERSGFQYEYSVFQMEVSRNLLFVCGQQLEQTFQALIDRSRSRLNIQQLKTIFGRRNRPHWSMSQRRHPPREEVVVSRPHYHLTVFKLHFGKLTLKLYTKGERVLRCEVIIHNTKALRGKRSLTAFPALLAELRLILERFLNHLHYLDTPFIADDTLDTLAQPGQLGQSRVAGIDLNKPRLQAVLQAVTLLAASPNGFTASGLAAKVREILSLSPADYLPRHAAYDLRKLRAKGWVLKADNRRRYTLAPAALQLITALLTLREKVIKPLLAGATKLQPGRLPAQSKVDKQYQRIQKEMFVLFHLLGIAV